MANTITHHEEFYRGQGYVKKINETRLVICGVGALGSNLAETLARQGYTNMLIIDMDRVETHNLGTQIFETDDIGQLKVAAVQNRIFLITGEEIETNNKELKADNIKKTLKGADLVVDAFDNRPSRHLLQNYCRENKIHCLHGGLGSDYGEVVWNDKYEVPSADVDESIDVCDYPLARNLIMVIVSIMAEEILGHCLENEHKNHCFTLRDMRISPYC